MPLTAEHASAGLLDATVPDLGSTVTWEEIYKPDTPAPLVCRGCGERVHAKLSVRGLRFFAHHRRSDDCPLNGETPEHRLLKSELAAAIRAAGWVADLEVAGTGWRADVLATSPDGARRIAWEAQLASTTADDLAERTATMRAELDGVCWVTDKDVPWVTRVPSVRIRRGDNGALNVVDGAARFKADWCANRRQCGAWSMHGADHTGPCSGHGYWDCPPRLSLDEFVAYVCTSRVVVHETQALRRDWDARHPGGRVVWAPLAYIRAETEQLEATRVRDAWEERQRQERTKWEANILALLARQDALVKPTVEHVFHATGTYPQVHNKQRDPYWAMGLPVFVGDRAYAVICPVASRVVGAVRRRLAPLTVIVASEPERARLAKACAPGQQIVVIPVTVPDPPPSQAGSITIQQAVRRMVGFG